MDKLEELYNNTSRGHIKMMTRILNGDWAAAEDVVQEAYTRAISYYSSYDSNRGSLTPWFNRILFNALRDIQREYKAVAQHSVKEEFSIEDVITSADQLDSIVSNIEEVVNEKHQRVLYLFYVLGYNSREIAEIEDDITQSNVTTIVARFKETLV